LFCVFSQKSFSVTQQIKLTVFREKIFCHGAIAAVNKKTVVFEMLFFGLLCRKAGCHARARYYALTTDVILVFRRIERTFN
jgi:hypothetical protein